jgi:hypothetical protein
MCRFTYRGGILADAMEAGRAPRYRIVVRGELGERFAYLFTGMHMERSEGTTILTGIVRDQAQLHGHIERIQELGLVLQSVERLGDRTAEDHGGGSSSGSGQSPGP